MSKKYKNLNDLSEDILKLKEKLLNREISKLKKDLLTIEILKLKKDLLSPEHLSYLKRHLSVEELISLKNLHLKDEIYDSSTKTLTWSIINIIFGIITGLVSIIGLCDPFINK